MLKVQGFYICEQLLHIGEINFLLDSENIFNGFGYLNLIVMTNIIVKNCFTQIWYQQQLKKRSRSRNYHHLAVDSKSLQVCILGLQLEIWR